MKEEEKFEIIFYNPHSQEDQILHLIAENELEAFEITSKYLNSKFHGGFDFEIEDDGEGNLYPYSGDFSLRKYYPPVFQTKETLF